MGGNVNLQLIYPQSESPQSSEECTIWIRASTGQVCVELTPGYQILSPPYFIERGTYQHEEIFADSVKLEAADVIASKSFLQYYSAFCEDPPTATLSELSASVSLGSILDLGLSDTGSDTVIAYLPVQPAQGWRYRRWYFKSEDGGEPDWTWDEPLSYSVVNDQWACIDSESIAGSYYYNADLEREGLHSWLAQANHIFSQSNISDRCERFAVVVRITIKLTFEGSVAGLPPGFLFLYCPSPLNSKSTDVRNSRSIAYWALDRIGQQRLSAEEAQSLGFPEIKAEIGVHVKSWDSTTYLILRQFHQGKGFDPDSKEVARHLGLAPISLTAPTSLSATPLKIEIEKILSKESGDRVCENMHVKGNEAGKLSVMFPRRHTFVLPLQCGLIVVSASLAVFVYLRG
ncbi:hypothetical protein K438DRAFT_759377 [Mycena galopus ATCC 62051]|nr:hypothetical protein K438DRAFT_759377 [Mycena galopus ATCC 62051]